MLRSCAAYEAYLRTYRRGVVGTRAVGVPAPRPPVPALGVPRVERGRERARTTSTRTRPAAAPSSEPRRLVGRACAELEFVRPDELEASLPQQLERLERAGVDAHVAIAERFFHASTAIRWSA